MARWWINAKRDENTTFDGATLKYEIDLGKCLDLTDAAYLTALGRFERALDWTTVKGVRPRNELAPTGHRIEGEYKKRYLDHAVIDAFCSYSERTLGQRFETVLGLFESGPEIYPGAGIYKYNNLQLAIREGAEHLMQFKGVDIY